MQNYIWLLTNVHSTWAKKVGRRHPVAHLKLNKILCIGGVNEPIAANATLKINVTWCSCTISWLHN